jgi:FkbM family methyltransferase
MEKIIHFIVRDPNKLDSVQSDAVERARKFHPAWEINVWRAPVPLQGENFLLEKYWSKVNSGAQFADLLRLDVLYRFGGVYVDSDLRLFKPLDALVQRFEFFIASEDGYNLTNALIGARKDSPLLRHLIDELNTAEPDWSLPPNRTTGPQFFSRQLKWRKEEVTVLPRESFYSYGPGFEGQKRNHRHAYGEHLWAYSWRDAAPVPHSRNNLFSQTTSYARRIGKKHLKKAVMVGFQVWHRLQSLWHRLQSFDPVHPPHQSRTQSYQCSGELVVHTIHGFRIVVDGNDISVTPELVFNGFYELAEQYFVKNVVGGGDWVIDVGANVGSFSLLAAGHVGPFGRVFSYEPNPRPASLMAKSLVMNWAHDRVIQRPVTVGDSRGVVELTFVSERLGDGQVGQREVTRSTFAQSAKALGRDRANVLQVPCVRLDDEFPIDLPIKVLKIGVKGYEGRVLAGAGRLLQRRCVDFIVMELLEEVAGSRWHATLKQVNNVIERGYAVCTLTKEGKLVEQKDLAAAIRSEPRTIVLAAREQYRPA